MNSNGAGLRRRAAAESFAPWEGVASPSLADRIKPIKKIATSATTLLAVVKKS